MREFAKRWIEADMAEAFPEVPREVLEHFAEGQAEQVAKDLSGHSILSNTPYFMGMAKPLA